MLMQLIGILMFMLVHGIHGQTDMFELHDKERGKMDLHVTKDKVELEATSDSVNMVMNPDDAAGRKRGGGFGAIIRDNSTTGFTVGNIGHSDISVNNREQSTGSKRFMNNNDDGINKQTFPTSILNLQSSSLHSDVMDYNVKRNELPLQNAKPKVKFYTKNSLTFETEHDENGVRKSFPYNNEAHTKIRLHRPKPQDINASKKSLNIRSPTSFQRRKNNRKLEEKDVTGTRKSFVGINTIHDDTHKRSGIKEMTLHNKLGGMRIKSNPEETAVISESGNIDITMVNNQISSNKAEKKHIEGTLNESEENSIKGSSRNFINELKSDNNQVKMKNRLHLADFEYTGMRKSEVIPKYKKSKQQD